MGTRLGIMLIACGMLMTAAAANGQKRDDSMRLNADDKSPERQHSKEKSEREADRDAKASRPEKEETKSATKTGTGTTTPDPCLKQPSLPQCR